MQEGVKEKLAEDAAIAAETEARQRKEELEEDDEEENLSEELQLKPNSRKQTSSAALGESDTNSAELSKESVIAKWLTPFADEKENPILEELQYFAARKRTFDLGSWSGKSLGKTLIKSSTDYETLLHVKKSANVDSCNDASSEDSNDSKGKDYYLIYYLR